MTEWQKRETAMEEMEDTLNECWERYYENIENAPLNKFKDDVQFIVEQVLSKLNS